MKCIFCRTDNPSTTIEHIIPESLGNTEHVLPKGVVCDKCNNYFAVKIEKKLLEKEYFVSLRQRNFIKSKKGRLVPDKVLFPHPKGGWVDAWLDEKGFILRSEEEHIISLLKNGEIKSMIIPTAPDPKLEDKIVSRFLAKVAFECVPYYAFNGNQYDDDFIDQNNLHPLREYARFGIGEYWPYSQRRIYSEEDRFMNTDIQPTPYEIMHELDFLMIALDDIYFILVIMGIEYFINLNGPTIESYESWLKLNNHISPIRRGKEYMIERK